MDHVFEGILIVGLVTTALPAETPFVVKVSGYKIEIYSDIEFTKFKRGAREPLGFDVVSKEAGKIGSGVIGYRHDFSVLKLSNMQKVQKGRMIWEFSAQKNIVICYGVYIGGSPFDDLGISLRIENGIYLKDPKLLLEAISITKESPEN